MKILRLLSCLMLVGAMFGCSKSDEDKAKDKIENAADKAKNAVDNAADKAKDALDKK